MSPMTPTTFHPIRSSAFLAAGGLLLTGASMLPAYAAPNKTAVSIQVAAPSSAQLAYDFKLGAGSRYKVAGIFSGHIPPFAQPGSPPTTLSVKLVYVATVKKIDAKGAEVEFTVDSADVSILQKEPGPDGKIDPDSEIPFPLPLSQVQSALNVTATLRPDGSVASVAGGDAPPVQIDLGLDLRKLFLLILPVTFPDKSVKVNDTWAFTDGLLGSRAGKVSYTGKLVQIEPKANTVVFTVSQNALATVDDKRDKAGKPTDKAADAVDATQGKVTLEGSMKFVTATGAKSDTHRKGHLSEGRLTLIALLNRKRTAPDPNDPTAPLETSIDIKARLSVKADPIVKKPAKAAKVVR